MLTCKRGFTPTQRPLVSFDAMIPYGRQDISEADIDAVLVYYARFSHSRPYGTAI